MAARTAANAPQDGGSESQRRFGLSQAALLLRERLSGIHLRVNLPRRLGRGSTLELRRPSPFVLAVTAVVATVAFVGILTFYGADEFSGRAADTRASGEAMSFAEHSSTLATGDAFDGYVQILRYADDSILNTYGSAANDRAAALQRLLYVNVNKFKSLTIVDRSGIILATTDSTISDIRPSTAFSETRANLAPANSDIILPEAGRRGYVEYSAPLRDPSGTTWGILLGRADPATLWNGTLIATVDGSRNVIINSQGLFSAGVPDELLRQPWHGRPLDNGGVRANIAGVDSICGLAPIGEGTQIDRGLNVASCLPASIIQIERRSATDKQGLITIAAAVLAIVIASLLLKVFIGSGEPKDQAAAAPIEANVDSVPTLAGLFNSPLGALVLDDGDAGAEAAIPLVPAAATIVDEDVTDDDVPPLTAIAVIEDEPAAIDDREPLYVPPPPDVDALTLIESYERRNAGLAERLRDTVQAKLLIAATEADQAFRLLETDAETAVTMHGHAMEELESIRKRELRSIGQELFPGLTRLGLPGAIKAMQKELRGVIDVKLDVDATADSVAGGASRSSVSTPLRLVVYRFALESIRALAAAGATTCSVSLQREGNELVLTVACDARQLEHDLDTSVLAASEVAAEAYAGRLALDHVDGQFVAILHVPAPPVAPGPSVELGEFEEGDDDSSSPEAEAPARQMQLEALLDEDGPQAEGADEDDGVPASVVQAVAVSVEPRIGLAASLEALQAEFFGSMIVALDIAPEVSATAVAASDILQGIATETLRALQAADARQCDISLAGSGSNIHLRLTSRPDERLFDTTYIDAYAGALSQAGGSLTIAPDDDGAISVSAAAPAAAAAADAEAGIGELVEPADAQHAA